MIHALGPAGSLVDLLAGGAMALVWMALRDWRGRRKDAQDQEEAR